jgi:hypothetical protein
MIDFDHRWHKVSDNVRDTIDVYTGQPVKFAGLNIPERGIRVHQGGVVDQKIWRAHGVEYVDCPTGYLKIVTDINAGKAMGCGIFSANGFDVLAIATTSSHRATGGY